MRLKSANRSSGRWIGILVSVMILLLPSAGFAAAPAGTPRVTLDTTMVDKLAYPVYQPKIQIAGNLRMAITNWGIVGFEGQTLPVVQSLLDGFADEYPPLTTWAAHFEFPAGTYCRYFYAGGLWVGGVVDGDTLVSTSLGSLSAPAYEFNGYTLFETKSNLRHSGILDPAAHGQFEMHTTYYDTLVFPSYTDDVDDRPHIPLGIEVSQSSYSWLSQPYDDIIIIVYRVRNIAPHPIKGAQLGVFVDPDVYSRWVLGSGGYDDDLSGYLKDHDIAYAIDNNGDPTEDRDWDTASVLGAIGVVPLDIKPEPTCTTFNWWRIGPVTWPPHAYPDDPPEGDRAVYRTMARGDIEYDQMRVVVDDPVVGGYANSQAVARGSDTRFVLSFGGFDLLPGDKRHGI